MKISPVSGLGTTVGAVSGGDAPQPTMSQRVRALKMNTNATPGYVKETAPEAVEPAKELTIGDANSDQAPAATEENQPLSPQFVALAKQRRALQVKEREIADRERALTEKSGSPDSIELARLKSDPLGVLLESGVTYEQLTEAVLATQSGVTPEVRALQAKIAELEGSLDKKLTDRDTQAEQAALAEMGREATLLAAEGDEFAMVRETKSIPKVIKLIELVYRSSLKETGVGEVLDVREALQLVENELLEDGLRLTKINKVHSQLIPPPAAPQPTQTQRQMRTLTNRDTASVPQSRKARALAAWNGTLKT